MFQHKEFKNALEFVTLAASQHDSRPILNAVYVVYTGNELVDLVCADGYRLHKDTVTYTGESFKPLILDLSEMKVVMNKIKLSGAAQVFMTIEPYKVIFTQRYKGKDIEYTAIRLEGKYPEYNSIIPRYDDNVTKIMVDPEYSELVSDTFAETAYTWVVNHDHISVTNITRPQKSAYGKPIDNNSKFVMVCQFPMKNSIEGKIEFGINAVYFHQANSENAVYQIKNTTSPILVTYGYTKRVAVIMPMSQVYDFALPPIYFLDFMNPEVAKTVKEMIS